LITLSPSVQDSYMFHFPNIKWTRMQAKLMRVPQVMVETQGVKEQELEDLKRGIKAAMQEHSIKRVYTGALASVYQKSRVERICGELGVEAVSPLWGIDQIGHLRNLIAEKFMVLVTAVAGLGLDVSWLGRMLDYDAVRELGELRDRYGINPGLEGGEGETFVLDCPLFGQRIEVLSSAKHWKGEAGDLEILDARTVPKG